MEPPEKLTKVKKMVVDCMASKKKVTKHILDWSSGTHSKSGDTRQNFCEAVAHSKKELYHWIRECKISRMVACTSGMAGHVLMLGHDTVLESAASGSWVCVG